MTNKGNKVDFKKKIREDNLINSESKPKLEDDIDDLEIDDLDKQHGNNLTCNFLFNLVSKKKSRTSNPPSKKDATKSKAKEKRVWDDLREANQENINKFDK